MFSSILKALFGTKNDKILKQYKKIVDNINKLESSLIHKTQEEIQLRIKQLKDAYQKENNLDALLPETFALVREAGKRTINQRHYDVQLLAGIALHHGNIAEMMTGEGKTLSATLPCVLHALTGQSVHVVTVNDYLAKRDAEWMANIYEYLGLTVGCIYSDMPLEEKKAAYNADITYATNNELGFDYLRDNLADNKSKQVQRELSFCVIDEVDSILIDEARTPLIISGQQQTSQEQLSLIAELAGQLKPSTHEDNEDGDFWINEKDKQIIISEQGQKNIEELLTQSQLLNNAKDLYHPEHLGLLHRINNALKALHLFEENTDYIIKNKNIVIIDSFTGRSMTGRRWSEGLHQAIEAKEKLPIQPETRTQASISFQNYFRLYKTISGMTGTADTEAPEFKEIYDLEVVVIPTHKPCIRQDLTDKIYQSHDAKMNAIVKEIKNIHKTGQPLLIGTVSIERSEELSKRLTKEGLKHEVLNAKKHQKEAMIIAQAGALNSITISTNMAGRGTDIVLGGNPQFLIDQIKKPSEEKITTIQEKWQKDHEAVKKLGGLYVLATERHESRRIDNQLRGRAGRQGDPGVTVFYLSLTDDLMRLFASDRFISIMRTLGMKEDDVIEHKMLNRSIEGAQQKVEALNFDRRKQLIEYDNVTDEQRHLIYQTRNELLNPEETKSILDDMVKRYVKECITTNIDTDQPANEWPLDQLNQHILEEIGISVSFDALKEKDALTVDHLIEHLNQTLEHVIQHQEQHWGEQYYAITQVILLKTFDKNWVDHLNNIDHLRQSINLRSYAQKNPKQEFKQECFEMFKYLIKYISKESLKLCFIIKKQEEKPAQSGYNLQMTDNLS
ncbi:MAG: preprotein translocase subunit SecA [Candidatus Comchoanobacterales bacterium]